jgi:hypothetical protein
MATMGNSKQHSSSNLLGGMLEVNAFLLGLCFPNPVNCLIVLQ